MSDNFVARSYRYHQLHEEPTDTIDEAIAFLAAGADQGECSPDNVTRPDGTVVLDHAETTRRIHAKLQEWDEGR